jgi:PadR family transcriptional regulator PadR
MHIPRKERLAVCDQDGLESGCCCAQGQAERAEAGQATCPCGGNIPRHFILPAILLLLNEEPSHGYVLFHKLSELGVMDADMSPATVYRVLSKLEEEGLTSHEYADDGQGPVRKVYTLTGEGEEALAWWRSHIEKARGFLDWFVKRASRG